MSLNEAETWSVFETNDRAVDDFRYAWLKHCGFELMPSALQTITKERAWDCTFAQYIVTRMAVLVVSTILFRWQAFGHETNLNVPNSPVPSGGPAVSASLRIHMASAARRVPEAMPAATAASGAGGIEWQ